MSNTNISPEVAHPIPHLKTILIAAHVVAFTAAIIAGVNLWTGEGTETVSTAETEQGLHNAAPQRKTLSIASAEGSLRAARLQDRLSAQAMPAPAPHLLDQALDMRSELLKRTIDVAVITDTEPKAFTMTVKPEWIVLDTGLYSARYAVDAKRVAEDIRTRKIAELPVKIDGEILSVAPDHRGVVRVVTNVIAKPGYEFDIDATSREIANAFNQGLPEVSITVHSGDPVITWKQADGSVKTLTLLSTGLSDFANSTPGRLHNVHKAFEEKIHNVLIPSGTEFSLVPTIDAPITLEKGWMEDLGLFGGGAAKTPGAGICQSATTIYRAALLAGLPITERRYHSLFVDHYEFYGIGLDATVFPGVHNLRFRNDTPNDILMQADLEGETAIVHFYGIPDGRTTDLDGPYFMRSKNRPHNLRALGPYEIGWVRNVTLADGTIRSTPITSSYAKPFFGYVHRTYEGADGMALLAGERLEKK